MNDERDPILDSGLEELLGGISPPDLSRAILQRLGESQSSSELEPRAAILPPELLAPTPPLRVAEKRGNSVRRTRRSLSGVAWGVAAACAGLLLVWAGASRWGTAPTPPIANRPSPSKGPATAKISAKDRRPQAPARPRDRADAVVDRRGTPAAGPAESPDAPVVLPQTTPEMPTAPPTENAAPAIVAAPVPEPLPASQVAGLIDREIQELWSKHRVTPPESIAAVEWNRRVFATLFGRAPTQGESESLKAASPTDRIARVEKLLSDERHVEEFARHWSERLTEWYLPAGLLDGSPASRDGMLQYFRRALLEGRSFDTVGRELLTATGSGSPGDPRYNGAANFLLARTGGHHEQATGDTARLFLGRNLACQQCHGDPQSTAHDQQEFWELNAFFRQLAVAENPSQPAELEDRDFLGEDQSDGRAAIVFYEQPDGLLKGAFPAVAGQSDLPKSGLVAEVHRRQLLAECLVRSTEFREATVNQFWTAVWGQPLVPVAAAESSEFAEQRELLTDLGAQFAAHGFDARRLLTWIAASETFCVPSENAGTGTIAFGGGATLFHRFAGSTAPRQYPSAREQLLAAAQTLKPPARGAAGTLAKVDAAGLPKDDSAKVRSPQLLLDQGPDMAAEPTISRIVGHPRMTDEQKLEHLFQVTLYRSPKRSEVEVAKRILEQKRDDPSGAWELVWQTLVVSR